MDPVTPTQMLTMQLDAAFIATRTVLWLLLGCALAYWAIHFALGILELRRRTGEKPGPAGPGG